MEFLEAVGTRRSITAMRWVVFDTLRRTRLGTHRSTTAMRWAGGCFPRRCPS